MKHVPYLSVVIPTHNVGLWIGETLESITAQSYEALEIIVVDDHSVDDTTSIVAGFAARDARVSLVHAPSSGGGNARNFGSQLAGGKYLVFADGDDIVPRGAYASMVASLEESGSDLAIGDFLKFSSTKTWHPSLNWPAYGQSVQGVTLDTVPSVIRHRACWNKVFRREFWNSNRISFPEVARSNDIVPMTTAMTAAATIDIVRDIVYLYRDRSGPTSMTARAASSASLLSYFRQEVECARLLAKLDDPTIMATYASLVLQADGWVHLDRWMLARETDDGLDPDDEAVLAADVRELLSVMSGKSFNRIDLNRQLLFALVAAGQFELARSVHRDFIAGEDEASGTAEFDRWIEIGSLIADVLTPDHSLGARLIERYLVEPLIRNVASLPPADVTAMTARIVGLADTLPTYVDDLNDDTLVVLEAGRSGDTTALPMLSTLRYSADLTVDRARATGNRLVLTGLMEGVPKDTKVTFMATRRGKRKAQAVGSFIASGQPTERWTRTISSRTIARRGVWDFRVKFYADGVTVSGTLRASASIVPHTFDSLSAMLIRPTRFAGAAIVVERRPPFVRRVISYGARRLPKGARTAVRSALRR